MKINEGYWFTINSLLIVTGVVIISKFCLSLNSKRIKT